MAARTVDDILAALDGAYSRAGEKPRRYIGASVVGKPCDAAIAFSLRGFPEDPIEPRVRRIFKLGHTIEAMVVADLKAAGLHVYDRDALTGEQYEYEEFGGHLQAHADGLVDVGDSQLIVLEIKGVNEDGFASLQERKLRSAYPMYFDQCQMLMAFAKIARTLFVAYAKNTSQYYVEVVEFDEVAWSHISFRIETVLKNEARRVAADPTSWQCRFCSRVGVCWNGVKAEVACHSCRWAYAHQRGGWWCGKHSREATRPCSDFVQYQPLPKESQ